MASCIEQLGCDPRRIAVHHLGVCTEQIAYAPVSWDGTSTLRILMASSFREKKNIPGAIRALAALREQRELDLRLTLIGDATDAPASVAERTRIERTLAETRMDACTRRLGFQSHQVLLEEAAHHHLFLHPSITATTGDTEGGAPIVLLDMLAAGLPIVSSTHCDIPHVIADGERGFLAEQANHESLVHTLGRALDARGRWRAITDTGRAHVEREFDATTQAARLAGLYFDVADTGTIPSTLTFEQPLVPRSARRKAA